MARPEQHSCLFCGEMFRAEARNAGHQKYCSEPNCRKASKAASRRAWLSKPENQDYSQSQHSSTPNPRITPAVIHRQIQQGFHFGLAQHQFDFHLSLQGCDKVTSQKHFSNQFLISHKVQQAHLASLTG